MNIDIDIIDIVSILKSIILNHNDSGFGDKLRSIKKITDGKDVYDLELKYIQELHQELSHHQMKYQKLHFAMREHLILKLREILLKTL